VAVSTEDAAPRVDVCHCRMCRVWGGGPFFAVTYEGELAVDGRDSVTVYDSSEWAERAFCNRCGTHLYYHLKGSPHYAIMAGLLEDQDDLSFEEQIFIDKKPGWYSFANETKNLTEQEVFEKYGAPSSAVD
jgi:hypothetical protein